MRAAVCLSFAVMHHPDRADLLPDLLAALDDEAEVVTDPEPRAMRRSPWRTHRHALETTPAGATHRVVVQDDVVPVEGFTEIARRALAVQPGHPVCFYVGGQPWSSAEAVRKAGRRKEDWVFLPSDRFVPCPAIAWPVELIEPTLEWVDRQSHWPETYTADDEILRRAFDALKVRVLATVPSLVEHPDVVPSTLRKRVSGGQDTGRVSCCPPPAGCDLLACDWLRGPR